MVLILWNVDNFDGVNNTSLGIGFSKLILNSLRLSVGTVKVEEIIGWIVDLVLNNSL